MEAQLTYLVDPEVESIDEIGIGLNELVLKFNEGMYKGRFFYVRTDIDGERIGSGSPEAHFTTVYIENAGLSEVHCSILFNENTSEYFLTNSNQKNSGVWIKLAPKINPENVISAGSIIKISEIEFFVTNGNEITLESVIAELISPELYQYNCRPKTLNTFNPYLLDIPTLKKEKLTEEVEKLNKLPTKIKPLVFTSEFVTFMVHYKPIKVGNLPDCDVIIPHTSNYSIKIQYVDPNFTINAQENSLIYRKLLENEETVILPGNVFRVGKIEFLASRFNVGRWSHIGKRQSMEDADVVYHNLMVYENFPLAFYSVYDGHGGSQCSQFLKEELHLQIRKNLLKDPSRCTDVINSLKSSIISAFYEVDKKFSVEFPEICNSVGSAAIVCLIIGDRILTVNLGDSRAVLCRGGRAIELSIDHKPDSQEEFKRILSHGGSVMLGRINSKLAVSRAFGDFEFKRGSLGTLVSIEPDITQIFLNPEEDEFLVIGCDGFFEAYSSQELVSNIRERLAAMPLMEQDPNRVIRELVNEAIFENRTTDNVTALLITLTSGISL